MEEGTPNTPHWFCPLPGPATLNYSFCYIFQLFLVVKIAGGGNKEESPLGLDSIKLWFHFASEERDLNVELNFLKVNSPSWALEGCRSLCFVLRLS